MMQKIFYLMFAACAIAISLRTGQSEVNKKIQRYCDLLENEAAENSKDKRERLMSVIVQLISMQGDLKEVSKCKEIPATKLIDQYCETVKNKKTENREDELLQLKNAIANSTSKKHQTEEYKKCKKGEADNSKLESVEGTRKSEDNELIQSYCKVYINKKAKNREIELERLKKKLEEMNLTEAETKEKCKKERDEKAKKLRNIAGWVGITGISFTVIGIILLLASCLTDSPAVRYTALGFIIVGFIILLACDTIGKEAINMKHKT